MDTTSWIIVGIFGVSLALYFIFTFAKKIELIQKITSSLFFPAIGTLYIYFLLDMLPDSWHTLKLSLISFLLISASVIIGNFFDSKKSNFAKYLLFIISLLPIILLYKSVFIIHRVPLFINIIAACSYVVLFALFFIIFIKKSSLKIYITSIISLIFASFIHYCSLLTLCYNTEVFNFLRFIGTSAIIGFIIFEILNNTIINLKLKKLISIMILLASYVLIALSNLMILY